MGFLLVSFALLFSLTGGTIFSSQSAFASSLTTLTVKAIDQNGVVLHMRTTITHNALTVYSGSTPAVFSGTVGQSYTITIQASNSFNVVFSQWTNGGANNVKTITLGSIPETIVADYKLITGIYIPLYAYPTTSKLNSYLSIMKTDGPSLPYVVAINPNSGPGTSVDSTFTNAISILHSSGLKVKVIGYLDTHYGSGSTVANVEGQISKYYSLYPHIDGIMFDEVDNTPATDSFYKTVTDYARALGAHFLRANPGAPIDAGKMGMFDTIAIGEESSYPSMSTLQADTFNGAYSKAKFDYTVYGQTTLETTWLTTAEKYLGFVYITNEGDPNPYDTVPSYFTKEVATLQAQ